MMSLELLLDAGTDARIRAEWAALRGADLPSQARHTGAGNAPHVTLLAARAVDASLVPDPAPAALARHATACAIDSAPGAGVFTCATDSGPAAPEAAGLGLPLPLHVGGLVVFGGPPRGLVLARLLALSRPLQLLHTTVHRRASGLLDLSDQTAPDHWIPHVTLASRLTSEQLASAIEVLSAAPDPAQSQEAPASSGDDPPAAVALRHWNGDTKTITTL